MFTGCNSEDKGSNINTSDELKVAKNTDQVTLKLLFMQDYYGNGDKPNTKTVLEEIEKRVKNNINVKLDFTWINPVDYYNKIPTLFSSGEDVDAFYVPGISTFDLKKMARDGQLKDITQLFPEFAQDLYSSYSPEELASVKVDGKIIAVPSLYPMFYGRYVIVREDLMKKYNIPEIKTFDDYETYLKTIKSNENGIIPGKIQGHNSVNIFAGAYDYVVLDRFKNLVYKWDDPDMKVTTWEQTPEFRQVIGYITEWNKNEYMDFTDSAIPAIMDGIIKGDISSFIFSPEVCSSYSVQDIVFSINHSIELSEKQNFKVKEYLLYPDKKVQRIKSSGELWVGGSMAFCAKSKNTERVLMFLNWIQENQENYDLFMYGISGKDYLLKDSQYKLPTNSNDSTAYLGWIGRNAFRNLKYERYPYGYPAQAKEWYTELISMNAKFAPSEGFVPDYNSIPIKYNSSAFLDDFERPLSSGTFDQNQTDKILERYKNEGVNVFIKSIQDQLDKWMKEGNKS